MLLIIWRFINQVPTKPCLIKTIVTTNLQRLIGEFYGAKVYDVLTGFKYIAELIKQFEQNNRIQMYPEGFP